MSEEQPTQAELEAFAKAQFDALTPEQKEQLRVQQQEQLVQQLAPLVRAFAPANVDDQSIIAITRKAVQDQETFGQVIDSGANPEARGANPYWGYHLKKGEDVVGTVWITKRFPTAPSDANQYGSLLGYALSPVARAIMMAQGYYFEFFQANGKPKVAPKLHLPS